MQVIFFLLLFFSLFLLSRLLTSTLSLVFLKVTRNSKRAIQILAVLFLPGVIIHELSHWLVANILFVPTGTIEFFPQVQGDSVKLGSVQIARTDIFRRFVIGVAPILGGLLVMLGLFWFLTPSFFPINVVTTIFLWVVFEVGNTMFSSSKDLEGAIGFAVIALLLFAFLVFLKIPVVSFVEHILSLATMQKLLQVLNSFFLIAIGIDGLTIAIFRLFLRRS